MCSSQITTTRKNRQSFEDALLIAEQQLVTPVDNRSKGLLARQRVAEAAGEKPKTVVQTRQDLLDGKGTRAGRSQLDGEREPVKTETNIGDGTENLVGKFQSRADRLRTGKKQLHGIICRQRRYRPNMFAAHPEALATRRQNTQTGASTQQVFGDLSGRIDHVLAIVEHDQQVTFTDHGGELSRVW